MSEALPADWVDDVAVERACAGRPVGRPLSEAERLLVVRELHARGATTNRIARAIRARQTVAAALVAQLREEVHA